MNSIDKIKKLVLDHVPDGHPDGQPFAVPVSGLFGVFSCHPTNMEAVAYEPIVALVLQGQKKAVLGKNEHVFSEGQSVIVSHDLPVNNRISIASPENPYIALIMSIDLGILRAIHTKVEELSGSETKFHSLAVGQTETPLIDALARLVSSKDNPVDSEILGPATREEIHFRLLQARHAGMLRRLLKHDSSASKIARALEIMRKDFKTPISVDELAEAAHMSTSAFYSSFKDITGSSPGQYLKNMRLLEAKSLISRSGQTVSAAAYAVGYTSVPQFSREYKRKFGISPSKETQNKRSV